MMTADTPLTEVARFLPPDVAQSLLCEPYFLQAAALATVRAFLMMLEHHEVTLDPIEMEGRLATLVYETLEKVKHLDGL